MKEYEKLAAEWRRTHVPILEVQLCRPLTMRERNFISLTYESAFLKAREMAAVHVENTLGISKGECADQIRTLGEKKV